MSSHKGRSHPKKKHSGHSRRHRRKRNLEKKWNPKHFPELKNPLEQKTSFFYIPSFIQDFKYKDYTRKSFTSYTSFPIQPYNNQKQQPFSLF